MPPKLDEGSETVRIQLVTTRAWIAMVDAWRKQQPGNLNRSEAIRLLAEMAAKAQS